MSADHKRYSSDVADLPKIAKWRKFKNLFLSNLL